MLVPPWVVCVSPWGIPHFQSDWSLCYDHGLYDASSCERTTIPLQPSAVTNISVKPDDVRYRARSFVRKIHGTKSKSNTSKYYLSERANSL